MGAIFRREIGAYFTSSIAYIFLAVFWIFSGWFFYATCVTAATTDMSGMFQSLFLVVIFLIPILTMRLFSEEKKQKTEQGLLTAPVSLGEIVFGKYFAALALYTIAIMMPFVYALIMSAFGKVEWGIVFSNFLALFLLGAAFISVGTLISALTENQIMSAVVCFVVLLFFSMLSSIASQISDIFKSFLKFTHLFGLSESAIYSAGEGLRSVIVWFDPYTKTDCYTSGVFKLVPLVFCLSFTAVFIYITFRVLETKRWSQN